MPRYDYRCEACENVFEVTQSFDSEPAAQCPRCSNSARRLVSKVAIHFKGSGWYSTDNRSGSATNGVSKTKEPGSSTEQNENQKTKKQSTDNESDSHRKSDAKTDSSANADSSAKTTDQKTT